MVRWFLLVVVLMGCGPELVEPPVTSWLRLEADPELEQVLQQVHGYRRWTSGIVAARSGPWVGVNRVYGPAWVAGEPVTFNPQGTDAGCLLEVKAP